MDVTSLVKDWLDGVQANNGIALLAASTGLNLTFNSKENQTTSHEPVLEISLNHVATADQATNATNASTAAVADALAGSASVNASQVNGDLTNSTIAGNRVTGTVANATNAATANSLSGILPIANGGTGSSTQNFVHDFLDATRRSK